MNLFKVTEKSCQRINFEKTVNPLIVSLVAGNVVNSSTDIAISGTNMFMFDNSCTNQNENDDNIMSLLLILFPRDSL